MGGPLEGIRVVDWTMWQFGPVASAMLGDLGAEVIKVEPRIGDSGRGLKQIEGVDCSLPYGLAAYFEAGNRNKKGIALDLTKPTGGEIIYRLVTKSDVFLENYRPGVAEKLGLGYETLSRYNPKLIYAAASGYGFVGPDRGKPAFDYVGQARAGLMWAFGKPGDPPLRGRGGLADQMGATMLAYGVMAALVARERQGIGQRVDVSHLASTMWLQGINIGIMLLCGKDLPRHDRKTAANPLWNHYRCADGQWLSLAMLQSDRYWGDLCRALGAPELAENPRFRDSQSRTQNSRELIAILDRIFARRTAAEWERTLEGGGDFIYQKVQSLQDLVTDQQVTANQLIVDFDHPMLGRVKMVNCPVQFSATPAAIAKAAPAVGENTEEILVALLGYSWEEVEQLRAEGAI